jgi:transposase
MSRNTARNTARNYLRQDDVMEQRQVPHTWRTRPDPLEGIWPQALLMLGQAPELEAKALFEHLAQCHPGGVKAGLLRTFQRRVRSWRLAEGPEKEVFFTQDHQPGVTLAVDWTEMGGLGITIEGKALAHKLFHAVLPYSNWEWAVRAHSESTLSLRGGLKAVLGRLGRVPRELLTDHSSTATHQLKRAGAAAGIQRGVSADLRALWHGTAHDQRGAAAGKWFLRECPRSFEAAHPPASVAARQRGFRQRGGV